MVKSDLKISLVQMNIVWENAALNRSLIETKIENLKGLQHIIVLPEMFNTGFIMNPEKLAETMNGPTVLWMLEQAKKLKCILTGSIIIKEEGNYYNRLLWILPNGEVAHYDKRHLFSYAGENKSFTAGEKRMIAQVNGWKICLQICYDLRFPVWARNADDYDVLVYVANWPEKRNYVWENLLMARSIENMSYVVGVNRVGIDGNGHQYIGNTSIYDPLGKQIATAGNEEKIITHTLNHSAIEENRSKFFFFGRSRFFYFIITI